MHASLKEIVLATATFSLLALSSESAPASKTSASNISKIIKDIADLKAELADERVRRTVLEKSLNGLQDILYTIQRDMIKRFEIINGQIDQMLNAQNVAFNARLSKSYENIDAWATIVFSGVETNIGNGYNSATGEFTAPIPGTYVFFSNILSAADKIIETSLQVNGSNKMYVYSGGKYHGSGSNMAVVHLKVGDIVKIVKHGPWGTKPFYIHPSWSSFSGFLLRADGAAFVPTFSPA